VIASVAFRNFKALRSTHIELTPFNLVIGPNGSGKTSLIEALLRLRTLSRLPLADRAVAEREGGAEIEFRFDPPHDAVAAHLGCTSEAMCDLLRINPPDAPGWPALQTGLGQIRSYVLDHNALARTARREDGTTLHSDGSNLAAVLACMREEKPDAFSAFTEEMLRLMPEFQGIELIEHADDRVEFALRLAEDGVVPAEEVSQGMLYLLGVLALAFDPHPATVLCIEEVDRGIHPRTLREVRDLLYRLSYPASFGSDRHPVQIIATTHSPYFIDLFRDHPEEVVISHKHGRAAQLSRLSDRLDLADLMKESTLGDMWFSGILGGVPEERS